MGGTAMDMVDLAKQYRETEATIKARIEERKAALGDTPAARTDYDLKILDAMRRSLAECAMTMEHYYDRSYHRKAQLSV